MSTNSLSTEDNLTDLRPSERALLDAGPCKPYADCYNAIPLPNLNKIMMGDDTE